MTSTTAMIPSSIHMGPQRVITLPSTQTVNPTSTVASPIYQYRFLSTSPAAESSLLHQHCKTDFTIPLSHPEINTTFGTTSAWNQYSTAVIPSQQIYPTKWHQSTCLRSDIRPRMKRQKGGACGNINSKFGGLCDTIGRCGCFNCNGMCDRNCTVPNAITHPVLTTKEKPGMC